MSLISLLRGKSAEDRAVRFLRRQGLSILACNQRYKSGEIDIIAANKDSHLFVEVKYRTDKSHGLAAEMVSPDKQQRIVMAAKLWLQENDPGFEKGCRFDVLAISSSKSGDKEESIEWLKNAFAPELW